MAGRCWLSMVMLWALLLPVGFQPSPAAEPKKDFTPVAPPAALHTVLRSNLKTLHDWLNDKDYTSAAETGQALAALAQLYSYQSGDAGWRKKTTALREAAGRVIAAARRQDGPACAKAAADCDKLVGELAKEPPPGDKVTAKGFKPFGSTKTWMVLMDNAYSDAKTAASAKEMTELCQAVAEEANVTAHLRADPRWRKMSVEVREEAMRVAKQAQGKDLEAARAGLKGIYRRCEACHEGFRR